MLPEKRSLGYVEQDTIATSHCRGNIAYPETVNKSTVIAESVQTIAAQLQLVPVLQRYPHQLSGGEQRRVMLARTLVYQPSILLFDEPFAGVDALLRFELVQMLKKQLLSLSVPVLYVTHDLAEAQYISQAMLVLKNGSLVEPGNSWLTNFLQKRF